MGYLRLEIAGCNRSADERSPRYSAQLKLAAIHRRLMVSLCKSSNSSPVPSPGSLEQKEKGKGRRVVRACSSLSV